MKLLYKQWHSLHIRFSPHSPRLTGSSMPAVSVEHLGLSFYISTSIQSSVFSHTNSERFLKFSFSIIQTELSSYNLNFISVVQCYIYYWFLGGDLKVWWIYTKQNWWWWWSRLSKLTKIIYLIANGNVTNDYKINLLTDRQITLLIIHLIHFDFDFFLKWKSIFIFLLFLSILKNRISYV